MTDSLISSMQEQLKQIQPVTDSLISSMQKQLKRVGFGNTHPFPTRMDLMFERLEDKVLIMEKKVQILSHEEGLNKVKMMNFHLFPTRRIDEIVGSIITTSKFTDLNGVEKEISTSKEDKVKSTYVVNVEDKEMRKVAVVPIHFISDDLHEIYDECEDKDPLYINDWKLGQTMEPNYSKTFFDMQDKDLSKLEYPEQIMMYNTSKNVGIVEEKKYDELCSKLIGRKRKRVDQADGDEGIKKKQKICKN